MNGHEAIHHAYARASILAGRLWSLFQVLERLLGIAQDAFNSKKGFPTLHGAEDIMPP